VAGRPAGRRGRPDLADIECDDEVDNEESNQYIGIVKKLMTRARDTQTCSETIIAKSAVHGLLVCMTLNLMKSLFHTSCCDLSDVLELGRNAKSRKRVTLKEKGKVPPGNGKRIGGMLGTDGTEKFLLRT